MSLERYTSPEIPKSEISSHVSDMASALDALKQGAKKVFLTGFAGMVVTGCGAKGPVSAPEFVKPTTTTQAEAVVRVDDSTDADQERIHENSDYQAIFGIVRQLESNQVLQNAAMEYIQKEFFSVATNDKGESSIMFGFDYAVAKDGVRAGFVEDQDPNKLVIQSIVTLPRDEVKQLVRNGLEIWSHNTGIPVTWAQSGQEPNKVFNLSKVRQQGKADNVTANAPTVVKPMIIGNIQYLNYVSKGVNMYDLQMDSTSSSVQSTMIFKPADMAVLANDTLREIITVSAPHEITHTMGVRNHYKNTYIAENSSVGTAVMSQRPPEGTDYIETTVEGLPKYMVVDSPFNKEALSNPTFEEKALNLALKAMYMRAHAIVTSVK